MRAKNDHDKEFIKIQWNKFFEKPLSKINMVPYNQNENTAMNLRRMTALRHQYESNYDNLIPNGLNWQTTDISVRVEVLLRRRIQNMCNGKVS